MDKYQVIVGDLGCVWTTDDYHSAEEVFSHYIQDSTETVVLMEDNEVLLEHCVRKSPSRGGEAAP